MLLDDGSTDESLAICNDIHDKKQERWPSIRVFSHPNMGVSKTRNKGIALSEGTAVMFMDQDDAMRSDFYTVETKEALRKLNKRGIDMVMTGMWNADDQLLMGTFASLERMVKKGIYPGNSQEIDVEFPVSIPCEHFFQIIVFPW